MNNAGAVKSGHFDQATPEDLDTMYNVNVKSTYMMTQTCLPYLTETKGKSICHIKCCIRVWIAPFCSSDDIHTLLTFTTCVH